MVEAGCFTHLAGVVTWREDGALEHRFVRYGEMDAQDEEVAALVREAVDETDEILAEVVATTPFRLNGDYVPGLRTEETNLGDLVADAILWEAQLVAEDTPDIALANGGSIRASIPEGDITFANILEVVPFINYVSTVHVTGRELLEALEVSCSATPKSLGGFPQVAGISFTIDTSVPFEEGPLYEESVYHAPANPGARVRIDEINGEPFDEDASYVLATTDFICAGGDTYHAFVEASRTSMKGCSVTFYETLLAFLTDACGGEVPGEYEQTSGRITVL